VNFIKADIEGAEMQLLNGAGNILTQNGHYAQNDIKLLICTYHRENDYENIKSYLQDKNFTIQHSKGFMLYITDNSIKAPYARRGLIRAVKPAK
jgi:hypothetical protein